MKASELFRQTDGDVLEIKVPSFSELLSLEEAPDFIKRHRKTLLKQSQEQFGSPDRLPPGVYRFHIKEAPPIEIRWVPSPHYNERPAPRIDMLVLHYTVTSSLKATVDWFLNPIAKVSAHYVLGKDGAVVQMVRDEQRAWHAGESNWKGESYCNNFSIGIEIVNEGERKNIPYTPDQYRALWYLCQKIIDQHQIPQTRVLGHSDISPYRKIDPGQHFDWEMLARSGIGIFPEVDDSLVRIYYGNYRLRVGDNDATGKYGGQITEPADYVRELQRDLRQIGYFITVDGDFGPNTRAVVEAFQRHFRRSRVDGVVDRDTASRIKTVKNMMA